MGKDSFPNVSIITVNYNGMSYLEDLLRSLELIDYPKDKLEIIVADNGSSDNSVEFVRREFPSVRVLEIGVNLGFAGGNDEAAKTAQGEYLAFINNDMRVDSDWLMGLVEPVMGDSSIVSTGSKILNWEGDRIDFVGGVLNYYGHGFQTDFHSEMVENHSEPKPILFACGGSMLVRRDLFLDTGGFDRDYFAFFEDIDLGWRLWIMGHKVWYAPKSISYHRGHGTASRLPNYRVRVLLERNALLTIYKNYEDRNLEKILPAALLLATKRALVHGGIDEANYRIESEDGQDDSEVVSKLGMSHLVAIDDFIKCLPAFDIKRQKIQSLRRSCDADILGLFGRPFEPNCLEESYGSAQAIVSQQLGIGQLFAKTYRPRVLMFCGDVMGEQMAGPAIRALELSRVLSKTCDVILIARGKPNIEAISIEFVDFESETHDELRRIVNLCDVIITSGHNLRAFPFLNNPTKPLVVDLYGPFVLENLEIHFNKPMEDQIALHKEGMQVLLDLLSFGDYFICASDRQKDFWMGMLTSAGRINPSSYALDKTVDGLLGVVPFGLPSNPPVHKKQVLKGVFPGISPSDKVLLWGGGLWDWFDPLTLIRAMKKVVAVRKDVKLFFMSKTHPSAAIAAHMGMPQKAEALANELGLLGNSVFFSDRWIPYSERENYLLEADLGVSTHRNHIETRYSFRTRLLDCIWAGLPIISTEGDVLGETMEQLGLGKTVKPDDQDSLAAAVLNILGEPDLKESRREAFKNLAKELEWEQVCGPLADFCSHPRKRTLEESLVTPDDGKGFRLRIQQLEKQLKGLEGELQYNRSLVEGFRQGKFIRLMERIHSLVRKSS